MNEKLRKEILSLIEKRQRQNNNSDVIEVIIDALKGVYDDTAIHTNTAKRNQKSVR